MDLDDGNLYAIAKLLILVKSNQYGFRLRWW